MIVLSLIAGIVSFVYAFAIAFVWPVNTPTLNYLLVVGMSALAGFNLHNYIIYFTQ